MRHLLIAVLVSLAACQSDRSKLERLRLQEATATAHVVYWRHVTDSLSRREAGGWDVKGELSTSRDSLREAQLTLDLAKRDVDRFLH